MKKLLYIGHSYHIKTKSTRFLMEIFEENYDVSYVSYDPYKKEYVGIEEARKKEFDILLVFQIQLTEDFLTKNFRFKQGVFFPMYDSIATNPGNPWQEYRHFKIINFSRSLHEMLIKKGYKSYYIQYFPEPIMIKDAGDIKSIFYWQRMEKININVVKKLFENMDVDHIHLHKAMDPMQSFTKPDEEMEKKITYSEWFDTADEMRNIMQESAFYIAPRQYEGIGMSFLEAMAMGRCVVAPDYPTMNEYIKDGENGILYNLDDVKPIMVDDIRRIQKNAYNYIVNGYNEWKCKKQEILKWIEEEDEKPLVTVVTIVKNVIDNGCKAKLCECISSVHKQEYPNIEHIIIDRGSTDGTIWLLDKYKKLGWINYYCEPDCGVNECKNMGIDRANGKYIVLFDSNTCFYSTDAVDESVYMLENSNADFSFASCRIISENGKGVLVRNPYIGDFVACAPFAYQTMFIKKDKLYEIGMYDRNYNEYADYELVFRMLLNGYRYVEIDKDIVIYSKMQVFEEEYVDANDEIIVSQVISYSKKRLTDLLCIEDVKLPKQLVEQIMSGVSESLRHEIYNAIAKYDEKTEMYYFHSPSIQNMELSDTELGITNLDELNYRMLIDKKDARILKFTKYFALLNRWLWLKLNNKNIISYFEKENYKSIAIYGIGEIGKRLLEELRNSTEIEVSYAIDAVSNKSCLRLKVYSPNMQLPYVDAIIVTVDYAFDEIKDALSVNNNYPIISIDTVIFNIE